MLEILNEVNDFFWTYIVITLLVICAVYFTIRTKGIQFSSLKETWKLLCEKSHTDNRTPNNKTKKSVNSFEAFAISLSSRVGTGNLAGVASAIFVGGPGAVFWMWVMALLGAATAFIESTLAQLYKKKGDDSFYGGPAYYMQTGLKKKWMGVLFAVLITITFGMANQTVQSNTLCDALADSMGIDKISVGIVLSIMTLIIIFGGVQRIAKFSSIVVPFMAIGYIALALYITCINITLVPEMFCIIIDNAFGMEQFSGGIIGVAIMEGVKRGLFSNEAGEGSAPNAAATADISHPVKQGILQSVGVFADTLVICTCTAFMILLSGLYDDGLDGILLTKAAIVNEIGASGGWFLTAAIFLFAYSTIIANYFYGETNIRFITHKKWAVNTFRLITGLTVMLGAFVTLQTAWSMVDICMGLMTVCNLIAILLLSDKAFKLLKNYKQQRKAGKNPEFHRNMMPEIEKDIECWE